MKYNNSYVLEYNNKNFFIVNIINDTFMKSTTTDLDHTKIVNYIEKTNDLYFLCSDNFLVIVKQNHKNLKLNNDNNIAIMNFNFYYFDKNNFLLSVIFINSSLSYSYNLYKIFLTNNDIPKK